ncbi:hypothetical protein NKDENANG_03713 [Candidatus Entotheonellaceae bacterium PAL068K]
MRSVQEESKGPGQWVTMAKSITQARCFVEDIQHGIGRDPMHTIDRVFEPT